MRTLLASDKPEAHEAVELFCYRIARELGSLAAAAGGLDALVDAVAGYLDQGYVRIKIKIKPSRDVADTAAVRDAFGAIALQVDANSAYTLADADVLAELEEED